MNLKQLNEGPCDVATKDDIAHMSVDEYAKYSQWKAECEDEHRRTPLSAKRFSDNEKDFRSTMRDEAYEPQMDWEKPSKDVDPFSDAGWAKYRSFKHGSATADKMAKDEEKRGNKRYGKYEDGHWRSTSTSDPKKWKELEARGYKLVESWKTPYFIKEATGKCKYCGCSIDSPKATCDCKYDSHDASGDNWVNEGIYAKNKEDPMNPEVLIQGYGRLMLNQLEDKVGRMFEELAVMCDKGDWSNVEYNLNKGLVQEFIKTINETYEELEQMRKRGGINSRGIKAR